MLFVCSNMFSIANNIEISIMWRRSSISSFQQLQNNKRNFINVLKVKTCELNKVKLVEK